jgi:hypothetical protein
MKGSVKTTCPTSTKAKLWRKPRSSPYARISASAVASPGTATGSVMSSSKARAARERLPASAQAHGTPASSVQATQARASSTERHAVEPYSAQTSSSQRVVSPLASPALKLLTSPAPTDSSIGSTVKTVTRAVRPSSHGESMRGSCLMPPLPPAGPPRAVR